MPAKVVKLCELGTPDVLLSVPEKVEAKLRFSKSETPLMQTCELTYSYENDNLEFLCTTEHADVIHEIDDMICTKISENSEAWFGQKITYDQIERMFRPTLQGGRNPRQTLKALSFKTFDANTKSTDSFPSTGSGVFIIKLEGVHFEEKACEARWSVVQAKECLPAVPSAPPMFL